MKLKLCIGIILVTLFISVRKNANAQSPDWLWAKSMAGKGEMDGGQSIAVDDYGNVYTTGSFEDTVDFDPGLGTFNLIAAGPWDIFISKLDSQGNFIWAKAMSGADGESGHSITLDASGNIYITGSFGGTVDFDPDVSGSFNITSSGSSDIFISKLDSSGNFVWAKAMGGASLNDVGISIALDASNNVYTTGWFHGTADFDPGTGIFNLTTNGNFDCFVSKLDNSGNFVWAKAMGGTDVEEPTAITLDTWGNVYTTGWYRNTADFDPGIGTFNLTTTGNGEMFISKLDNYGNFVWAKAMDVGTNLSVAGFSIAADPSANVYTTGYFQGTVDFDPGNGVYNLTSAAQFGDLFISKLDSSGNFQWVKATDATNFASGKSLVLDTVGSGSIYTAGYFGGTVDFDPGAGTFNLSAVGGTDIFISKSDISGNFIWAKAVGGAFDDECESIALNGTGSVHMTGYFDSGSISFGSTTLTNAGNTFASHEIFIARLDTLTITGNNETHFANEYNLFPNPFSDQINITTEGNELLEVNLFDVTARKLLQQTFTSSVTLNTSQLAKGIYVYEVRDKSGVVKKGKVIKD